MLVLLFVRHVVRRDEIVLFLFELSEEILGTEEVVLGRIGGGLGVEALPAGQVLLAMFAGGTSQKLLHLPNILRGQDLIVYSALACAPVPGGRYVARWL